MAYALLGRLACLRNLYLHVVQRRCSVTVPDSAEALVEALLEPRAYPLDERPSAVVLKETHISWLFLTGRYVYKVKKPVDFGFLDFTCLQKRRHFCHEEVRLNQRLSPTLYLGVIEVRQGAGIYTLGGHEGKVVDYAVKMRQLPNDCWLSDFLRKGTADLPLIRRLARRIAGFHKHASSSHEITRKGNFETIGYNVEENLNQTQAFLGKTLLRETMDIVKAYTRTFMRLHEEIFRRRERGGFVRDCHGDLHIDQICIQNGIEFIDCIEFNERFRYTDVASDIAFAAIGMDYYGRTDLARGLLEEYVHASGDDGVRVVWTFYKCYRAYTRGKVLSFLSEEAHLTRAKRAQVSADATQYFELARSYSQLQGPIMIITTGLMGSGKSTLCRELASRLGGEVLSSDVQRRELAGLASHERRRESWGEGIYSRHFSDRTYDAIHQEATRQLDQGKIVLVDASYRLREWRHEARATAHGAQAPFVQLDVRCDERVLRKRLLERQRNPEEVSDGRTTLLESQKISFETEVGSGPEERLVVNTTKGVQDALPHLLEELYGLFLTGKGRDKT